MLKTRAAHLRAKKKKITVLLLNGPHEVGIYWNCSIPLISRKVTGPTCDAQIEDKSPECPTARMSLTDKRSMKGNDGEVETLRQEFKQLDKTLLFTGLHASCGQACASPMCADKIDTLQASKHRPLSLFLCAWHCFEAARVCFYAHFFRGCGNVGCWWSFHVDEVYLLGHLQFRRM